MKMKSLTYLAFVAGAMNITDSLAFPEFVIPTGATGCIECHLNSFGGGGFNPGVLNAAKAGIPGLKDFILKKHCSNPKTANPVECGKPNTADTAPVLLPIRAQWDVTVGDAPLVIPLVVSDAEDDFFTINVIKTWATSKQLETRTAVLSQEHTDIDTNLPAIDFKWQPTAAEAGMTYTVKFYAQEKGNGRKKLSNEIIATINVWPARHSTTKNVSQFKVHRSQWNNNQLNLAGTVIFKTSLKPTQRQAALKKLNLTIYSNSGAQIGSPSNLVIDSRGSWKKTWSLNATMVPCVAKLEFEGLMATSSVKLAPKTCQQ